MRILITGANGFLGSRVTARALAEGHEVLALVRLPEQQVPVGAEKLVYDLRRDGLDRILPSSLDAVLHTAAKIHLGWDIDGMEDCWRGNILGTQNVARAVMKCNVTRVVYTSSASVYRTPALNVPIDETAAVAPVTPYALSKFAGELIWMGHDLVERCVSTVVFRCSSIYGVGQRPDSVLPTFIERVRRGLNPVVRGNGLRTQDFVSVDDVAKAHVLALKARFSPGVHVFNLGSGEETSMQRLAEIVIRIFDASGSRVVENCEAEDSCTPARFFLDVSHAQRELGYRPQPLQVGLTEYLGESRLLEGGA